MQRIELTDEQIDMAGKMLEAMNLVGSKDQLNHDTQVALVCAICFLCVTMQIPQADLMFAMRSNVKATMANEALMRRICDRIADQFRRVKVFMPRDIQQPRRIGP